jgi:hypothetical protein
MVSLQPAMTLRTFLLQRRLQCVRLLQSKTHAAQPLRLVLALVVRVAERLVERPLLVKATLEQPMALQLAAQLMMVRYLNQPEKP